MRCDSLLLRALVLSVALLSVASLALAQACGKEGQTCCPGLKCTGKLLCDAPKCDQKASKCKPVPAYPAECGVLGKPCCPLYKCTKGLPATYPPSTSVYDAYSCAAPAVCEYGVRSYDSYKFTKCVAAGGPAAPVAPTPPPPSAKVAGPAGGKAPAKPTAGGSG